MTDTIELDKLPMVSPEAFNTQTSAPMVENDVARAVESSAELGEGGVPVSSPNAPQQDERVKREEAGDAMQGLVEEAGPPPAVGFSGAIPAPMQGVLGSDVATTSRIEPISLLPLSSSSPTITPKEWEGMIRNVATLEQELGPDNLQVGEAYLFLARVLQFQGTAPALGMAQHALQRAYEILVHWRMVMDGTKTISCADSFQYLFERIQKKIEAQQQTSASVPRA
ncbi:hypothetical protein BSKO_04283 [Bryopsis sp. KO-2023]|nr:hypothetical protein BSKO_04283 [Bryopsis sp. KO-2023]